jgi:citrate lyase subunit beta/citryl-CoA lyase
MAEGKSVGSENQGDCQVSVAPSEALEIEIQSKNPLLLEAGLREVVARTTAEIGVVEAAIVLAEQGAVDYVVAARLETALRRVFPKIATPIHPHVERRTTERDRPRRSRLYAPGNNPRLLASIELHGADCVLLDLEDSVPFAEKDAARILVKHLLAVVDIPEVWIRINPLEICGREDLEEVICGHPHGICLPKAQSAEDVHSLAAELTRLERTHEIEAGTTWIMPIIETAAGVLHAPEIATADTRVVMLAFGAEDFTRDVGAKRNWNNLLFARSLLVAAAKAANVQVSDTVYVDLEDEDGLITEAERARDLGFDGKGAINPRQIPPIHAVFSPNDAKIAEARRIVEAAGAAEAGGIGAVAVDGKMIDRPVLERARQILKYAETLKKERS